MVHTHNGGSFAGGGENVSNRSVFGENDKHNSTSKFTHRLNYSHGNLRGYVMRKYAAIK